MSALKADVHVAPPHRSNSVAERHAGLPPRRPTSARASFMQQKLQSALSQAATEKPLELAAVASQTNFRCNKRFSLDDSQCDRSVYRYRNEAAIVSYTDPASAFAYSTNFLPGAHFYTFLASRDSAVAAASVSTSSLVASVEDTGGGTAGIGGSGSSVTADANTTIVTALAGLDGASKTSASLASVRKKTALRMWIPDTVVYGETGRAVWLSSDKDGFVQRCSDFSERQVLEKLGNPTPCDGIERAVVVYKEPVVSTRKRSGVKHALASSSPSSSESTGAFTSLGNQLRLLSPGELKTLLSHAASSKKCFVVQQFVKCNGSKAFVVRAVHEAGKPAYAWMISNVVPFQDANAGASEQSGSGSGVGGGSGGGSTGALALQGVPLNSARDQPSSASAANLSDPGTARDPGAASGATGSTTTSAAAVPLANRLCTSVQIDKSCTFVKLNERGCTAVSELNQRLVKHVEHKLHVQLQSLVADYIKDAAGRWWLLQVKAFRVKSRVHPERAYSLPVKLRVQYLSYRDSSILEDNSESDDDDSGEHSSGSGYALRGHSMAALAQRQVRKLVQCKCCLASYPKSELSFKMTLKMISETLMRLRARLPPDKSYTFLTAALSGCETHDSSLAYESWSVCSFCYAIYERDQQLKRVETKFSVMLGLPNAVTAAEGLSRTHDRTSFALDPNSLGSVLPPQLTLCRLALVFNAIYDIPKELYDAEQLHFGARSVPIGARKTKTLRAIASKLYLRVTALGYTECIPLCANDIEVASTKAPRGATLRRSSTAMSDIDVSDEAATSRDFDPTSSVSTGDAPADAEPINYWLPINIIRTIHFAAPRTPLQSKLKDTSGIASLLNEESNIVVQFIRATEPPLKDPAAVKRRSRTRRAALIPEAASVSEMVSEMQQPHHSVLLGSTTIRMSQFRSAYVTKIDFYACMALSGELFNLKGNIGLERLRYVDTKLLTSQYRLRMFHGVFIPDESYVTSDPLSSEWMDALLVSFHKQARLSAKRRTTSGDDSEASDGGDANDDGDDNERARGASPKRLVSSIKGSRQQQQHMHQALAGRSSNQSSHLTRSTTSLSSVDNGEMDEELEAMIDRANSEQQQAVLRRRVQAVGARTKEVALSAVQHELTQRHPESSPTRDNSGTADTDAAAEQPATASIPSANRALTIAERKQELLPATMMPSRFDLQVSMLLKKSPLSPRSALADVTATPATLCSSSRSSARDSSQSPLSPHNVRRLWCLMVLLNEAHHLQSREHAFCRWECHYTLLAQKRSAVERPIASHALTHVHFTCTHKFYVAGTAPMLQSFLHANATVALHLRNDMYASTRARSQGEFVCELNLLPLLQAASFETTLDIRLADGATRMTPREAAAVARTGTPYLSVAVHLAQLALDPADATATGDFLELSHTREGLQVLRKIS